METARPQRGKISSPSPPLIAPIFAIANNHNGFTMPLNQNGVREPNRRIQRLFRQMRFGACFPGFPPPVFPARAMNKKDLGERDICTKYITPALIAGGKWDLLAQIREEVAFTKGRGIVRGPFPRPSAWAIT